jgi:ABC-type Zn2+ transport system substrate-binding protein/surface adhesin
MKRLISLFVLIMPTLNAYSEDHVQLSAHVHGISELEIVKVADELQLWMISPAYNLIGFEHEPGNEKQMKQMNDALHLLKSPERFLSLNTQAGCKLISVATETPLANDLHPSGIEKHDEDEQHAHRSEHPEHKHEGEERPHADIQAHYHYRCANPENMTSLKIDLFSHFPLIEKIQAKIITQTRQFEMELTPETAEISLPL